MYGKLKISLIAVVLVIVGYGLFEALSHFKNSVLSDELYRGSTTMTFGGSATVAFEGEQLACNHIFNDDFAYLAGGAVIDTDNSGKERFFATTGSGQKDCLLEIGSDGKVTDIIDRVDINNTMASFGAFAIDVDEDKLTDLFVTREDGLYLYRNKGGRFEGGLLYDKFEPRSIPVDIAVSDIDRDGDIDLYISTFIQGRFFTSVSFNNAKNRQRNILLENIGDLQFVDSTAKFNLEFSQNVFTSNFVDLNNDGYEDLVVAPNTDAVRIYKNDGTGRFDLAYKDDRYGFWMGIGIADIDSDGYLDLFFSNSGRSIPEKFLQGDSTDEQNVVSDFLLLKNLGNFQFKNVLPEIYHDELPFGWGIVAHDFNFDNADDFLIMENYIKWKPHNIKKNPGSLLVNTEGMFTDLVSLFGLENRNYGFSALIGDLNGDGLDDVLHINIGGNYVFHKNVSVVDKDRFVVQFPSRYEYINAIVSVEFDDETAITKQHIKKQGTMTTQKDRLSFYFQNNRPTKVHIKYLNGEEVFEIAKNQRMLVIE